MARQSSNSFASTANQNSGNYITDVSTTRVMRPPGGGSSLSLGWGDGGDGDGGEAYGGRGRGRVLGGGGGCGGGGGSPGGGCGGGGGVAAGGRRREERGGPPGRGGGGVFPAQDGRDDDCYSPGGRRAHNGADRGGGPGAHGARSARPSSNAYAAGNNQNSGNVITDTPTTRINAPPGGATSFSFGWEQAAAEDRSANARRGAAQRGAPERHADEGYGDRGPPPGRADARGGDTWGGGGGDDKRIDARGHDDRSYDDRAPCDERPTRGCGRGDPREAYGDGSPRGGGGRGFEEEFRGGEAPPRGGFEEDERERAPPRGGGGDARDDFRGGDSRNDFRGGFDEDGRPPRGGDLRGGDPRDARGHPRGDARASEEEMRQPHGDPRGGLGPHGGRAFEEDDRPPGGADFRDEHQRRDFGDTLDPRRDSSHGEERDFEDVRQSRGEYQSRGDPSRGDGGRLDEEDARNTRRDSRFEEEEERWAAPRGGGRGGGVGPGERDRDVCYGARSKVSSNTYASGSRQNGGNVITDHPSTRVVAPPGGGSSFSLGWDYGDGGDARERERKDLADRQRCRPRGQERGMLFHEGGSNYKEDIEGSKPRPFKPGIRLNAPPGGGGTFTPDWDTEAAQKYGGKNPQPSFSGGAGGTRDQRGTDQYRFYQQEEDRPRKQHIEQDRPHEEQGARDTHRYYLAGDNRSDRIPGKAPREPAYGPRGGAGGSILQWGDER